jgi:hypothetical protein
MTSTDMEALAGVVVDAMKEALRPRDAKIIALEAKVAELDARGPGVEYKGVYVAGTIYPKGSAITRDGSLWLALRETTLVPGTSPTCWRLIVKSGTAR